MSAKKEKITPYFFVDYIDKSLQNKTLVNIYPWWSRKQIRFFRKYKTSIDTMLLKTNIKVSNLHWLPYIGYTLRIEYIIHFC